MSHRIREAMRNGSMGLMGGDCGRVEVDETYIGKKFEKEARALGPHYKLRVVSLVDRSTGEARSISANSMVRDEVAQIVRANVAKEAILTTDEARFYWAVDREFAAHERVLHGAGEYVRGEVYTNTVDGFFSIVKRGVRGIYQDCDAKHLHRYLAEFDFRYSSRVALGHNDADRADTMLRGIAGKRLTYQQSFART